MIVYSGTKSQFHSNVISNDIGGIVYDAFKGATGRAWEHEEIVLKPLNPEYADIVIRDAADEEFVVVAELIDDAGIRLSCRIHEEPIL